MGFLESGHYELNCIKSLDIALKLHYNTIGIDFISKKIREVSRYAFNEFKNLNLLNDVISAREFHFNIFNLKIDHKFYETFERQQIFVSKRGNGLRLGLHYYNSQEDIDQFIAIFKAFSLK